jgi:hypothetical protein
VNNTSRPARVVARLSLVHVEEPRRWPALLRRRLVRHGEALLEWPLVAIWRRHLLAP